MSGAALPDEVRARRAGRADTPVNGRRSWVPPAGSSAVPSGGATALPLGGDLRSDGSASFVVWAPSAGVVLLRLHTDPPRVVEMISEPHGYHTAVLPDVTPGARYTFELPDGSELPDPASRHQPDGVHGPSELTSEEFHWGTNDWRTPHLRDLIIYEMHIGTFTPEGTFDAAIERLPALRQLGITAIEIMPVAQFPGTRNWGYDGVFAFAAQSSYGGPAGLKRFVDAAHANDLNVILDVVYNHLGPEGNYLPRFGPYFTETYHTPWGAALNFDDAGSDEVRRYFIESALQWTDEFRIDGLRLDAIHAIIDRSATPFLRELASAVHDRAAERGRSVILIAESDLGDARVLRPESVGGMGIDAQWLDDFHHSLRTLLTGEDVGYYTDYGTLGHFARACQHGFVYAGEYSRYRGRRHGAPAPDVLPRQFVVYAQNHDQIGNRMTGDRLTEKVTPAQLRLAAAAVLLAPFTPMLFMGEEYGEKRPFPFFVEFGDPDLISAVREGRHAEFASFSWQGEPPDPQSEETHRSAVLNWNVREQDEHGELLQLHARLIDMRRTHPGIHAADAISTEMLDTSGRPSEGGTRQGVVMIRRRAAEQSSILLLNFAASAAQFELPDAADAWRIELDTSDAERLRVDKRIELAPHSAVLLLHDEV